MIEADEYDTAFFDKRAKFVHYRPRTLILNNLEFDHADIYENLGAIQKQFHHLVRTMPASGRILWNAATPTSRRRSRWARGRRARGFAREARRRTSPGRSISPRAATFPSSWCSRRGGRWARCAGTCSARTTRKTRSPPSARRTTPEFRWTQAIAALAEFKGVKRRMELRGEVRGIAVYDDFAHHPTAIASTIDGLRRKVGSKRIVAVLEPRSATMSMGVHRDTLAPSLAAADAVWMFAPPDLGWDADAVVASLGRKGRLARSLDELLDGLSAVPPGDQVLIMSNGGFGGLHGKLLEALAQRATRHVARNTASSPCFRCIPCCSPAARCRCASSRPATPTWCAAACASSSRSASC